MISTRPVQRRLRPRLELEDAGEAPRFVRIAEALVAQIRRGVLRPGDPLPSSRRLAEELGVHRNTVLAALAELDAEGWTRSEPARGVFVRDALPERRSRAPRRGRDPERLGFALPARGPGASSDAAWAEPELPAGVLPLGGGVPDVRLVPTAALARAHRRALLRHGPRVLSYGDPRGAPELRAGVAALLAATRSLPVEAEDVQLTRGSQQALELAARVLIRPGDRVAVEALGYRPAWRALEAAGARLVPVPVDAEGLSLDGLDAALRAGPLRAVYVTPHHQFPTTVTLSAPRRLGLLARARAHGLAILEDDYDHELHYEGRPIAPLASRDTDGLVLYFGSLSKILAPGLRTGWVVGPRPVLARIAAVRRHTDRQGELAMELALAELFEDGEILRHARRMRRIYLARRDHAVACLRERLGHVLELDVPGGAMALWTRLSPGLDAEAWATRALARGVAVSPGRRFRLEARPAPAGRRSRRRAAEPDHLRIGYAAVDETRFAEGVERLREALAT
jgi:GntR family transcriptional regulator/MocR family aminotransferase